MRLFPSVIEVVRVGPQSRKTNAEQDAANAKFSLSNAKFLLSNIRYRGGLEMRDHEHTVGRAGAEESGFGPFRLTRTPLRLWRGRREIRLQPRQLAVLRYLVEHADAVVSREELLQAVWKGTVVTPAALQVCVRAIRAALG